MKDVRYFTFFIVFVTGSFLLSVDARCPSFTNITGGSGTINQGEYKEEQKCIWRFQREQRDTVLLFRIIEVDLEISNLCAANLTIAGVSSCNFKPNTCFILIPRYVPCVPIGILHHACNPEIIVLARNILPTLVQFSTNKYFYKEKHHFSIDYGFYNCSNYDNGHENCKLGLLSGLGLTVLTVLLLLLIVTAVSLVAVCVRAKIMNVTRELCCCLNANTRKSSRLRDKEEDREMNTPDVVYSTVNKRSCQTNVEAISN